MQIVWEQNKKKYMKNIYVFVVNLFMNICIKTCTLSIMWPLFSNSNLNQ